MDKHEPWRRIADSYRERTHAYGFSRVDMDALRAQATPRKNQTKTWWLTTRRESREPPGEGAV